MLDFVKNNNPVAVYKALAAFQGEYPDFLENYEIPSEETLRKYASTAFADPDTRSFPIYDPASTLLSAACYYGAEGEEKAIEQELVKAAHSQGIYEIVEAIRDQVTPMKKSASEAYPVFAMTVDYGDHQEGLLPIGNEYQVKESARGLATAIYEHSIPLTKAAAAATTIVKAARALDIPDHELPEAVNKFAEQRGFDPIEAEIQLSLRKKLSDPEAGEIYDHIFKMAAASDENLESCTELLEDMDRDNIDIRAFNYTGITDAWTALHSGIKEEDLEKLAAQFVMLSFDEDTLSIPIHAVRNTPHAMIKAAFTSSVASRIVAELDSGDAFSLGALVNSLDDELKREFAGIVAEAN